MEHTLLPEWSVSEWLNTPAPITLKSLRGKVVVLEAFQMLCPGCVQRGLPQAKEVFDSFDPSQVAVIGLHTVFEHHAAMGRTSLEAFLYEYRIGFPVGIDQPGGNDGIPLTMARYGLQGTPSLLLVDKQGKLRMKKFGHEPDLRLGAAIMKLVDEAQTNEKHTMLHAEPAESSKNCTPEGCTI